MENNEKAKSMKYLRRSMLCSHSALSLGLWLLRCSLPFIVYKIYFTFFSFLVFIPQNLSSHTQAEHKLSPAARIGQAQSLRQD
jgi:hypothetical protein